MFIISACRQCATGSHNAPPILDCSRPLKDRMVDVSSRPHLLLSLQRALLDAIRPQFRQALIKADIQSETACLRFEHDGQPGDEARADLSKAAADIIAVFPSPWRLNEQHVSVPLPGALQPLRYLAFRGAAWGATATRRMPAYSQTIQQ